LRSTFPSLAQVGLYDIDPRATERFIGRVERELPGLECQRSSSIAPIFETGGIISFATVAGIPHVESLDGLPTDATILHLSLRDLAPSVIRAVDNIVDDTDHVLRARTSLHLTELEDGKRAFVRCPLADVLAGEAPARIAGRVSVFSPFGLGILDLAVGRLVLEHARRVHTGVEIHGFLPEAPT
jgi:ornithine cyclodeaminase/alanine dehydrogenase-like protein (mu-crystallin family)